ncbi:hypothetical protein [Kitasatospora sp. NPDC054795]
MSAKKPRPSSWGAETTTSAPHGSTAALFRNSLSFPAAFSGSSSGASRMPIRAVTVSMSWLTGWSCGGSFEVGPMTLIEGLVYRRSPSGPVPSSFIPWTTPASARNAGAHRTSHG